MILRRSWDFLLSSQIAGLGIISCLVIFSINKNLVQNQLVFWLIGLTILILISFFNFRNFSKLSYFFYFLSLLMLLLLLLIGDPVRGSVRWIELGVFRFQPSEITKAAAILALANFFKEKTARELKNLVVSFLIILPVFILVFLEPDIGNALTLLAIWLGIVLFSGLRLKTIFTVSLIAVVVIFMGFKLLAPYQKQRLETFINPGQDPLGTGYHIIQSKIAVGSGGFLGRGLGHGSQSQLKFLPEAQSDFIFASIAEQLGFFGAGLTVILFTTMILRLISLAKDTEHFASLVIVGTISFLLFQFSINVGMNMGLFPVTGITFPLVSYGGSSLISTLFLLGIVINIRRTTQDKVKYYQHFSKLC